MFLTTAPPSAPPPPPPTPPTPAPDGRRAGATWVAATGAFLLLAAAAVFIAVRWDTLPEAAKLALVGALTGAFIAGGRALKRTLPATGDVLFHLGAFLLPVDVAGLCVRSSVGWRYLLVTEGVLGVGVLGALARVTGSVVLRWAAGASMLVLAVGVAAVSPFPAPLLLALAAAAAHITGRRRAAIAWAACAGLAPVLAAGVGNVLATMSGRDLGAGTLVELGLAGTTASYLAAVSGVICAVVLGREAHARKDLALVALAGASLVCGAGTTWAAAEPTTDVAFLTAPAVFVALQLVAMVSQRDEFWRRPARALALAGEVVAAVVVAPLAVLFVLVAPLVEEGIDIFSDAPPWSPEPVAMTAWLLLAGGWLLAAWRRRSPMASPLEAFRTSIADDRTVLFLVSSLAAALVVGSASTVAIAAGLLAIAVGLVAAGGVLSALLAVPLVTWAPVVVAGSHPASVLPVGLLGAAVLTLSAIRWAGRGSGVPTIGFTVAAGLLTTAVGVRAIDDLGVSAALLVVVFATWAIAAVVERASIAASFVARLPMVLVSAGVLAATHAEALPVLVAATFLLVVDAIRTDDPRVAFGATVTLPLLVFAGAGYGGFDLAGQGVAMAVSAAVLAGASIVTPERWRLPVLTAAAASIGVALPLTVGEPARFAEVLILAGGLIVAAGAIHRHAIAAHAGGALATVGIAIHLSVDGVTATEPYLLPVALQLVVLGVQLRRREQPVSSWVAFAPAIALLGVSALAERIDSGPAWHALVAGAVGVLAVAAGGWKRLAAPLFLGTALVAAVTVLETLHTLAGVPTWAWLAAGGSLLLATGVALERAATTPVEAGRRLVDVVSDRFD